MKRPEDVDEYIRSYPKEIQNLLEKIRATIKRVVPQANEVISYGMPAFKYHGMVAWFAAHTKHLGFYPGASGIEAFKKELSNYKGAKGSVQFPFDKPLPLDLVKRIVKFKVNENLLRIKAKKKAV